jgi:hypothetical protein
MGRHAACAGADVLSEASGGAASILRIGIAFFGPSIHEPTDRTRKPARRIAVKIEEQWQID